MLCLATRRCVCDCGDFEFRKARHEPSLFDPDGTLCKHLKGLRERLIAIGAKETQGGRG